MEVGKTNSTSATAPIDQAGQERSAALAEKRRALSAEQVAKSDAARAERAEQLAEIREAIARVVGANTRLSVARSEMTANFVYRAIDIDTGEVVHEWPQDRFIELIRGVQQDVRTDVDAGLWLDRVA
jgi:flagellar protein FlaG